jgi:hypothetical protein
LESAVMRWELDRVLIGGLVIIVHFFTGHYMGHVICIDRRMPDMQS